MKGIAQPFTSITSQVKFKASAAPEKSAPVAGGGVVVMEKISLPWDAIKLNILSPLFMLFPLTLMIRMGLRGMGFHYVTFSKGSFWCFIFIVSEVVYYSGKHLKTSFCSLFNINIYLACFIVSVPGVSFPEVFFSPAVL